VEEAKSAGVLELASKTRFAGIPVCVVATPVVGDNEARRKRRNS